MGELTLKKLRASEWERFRSTIEDEFENGMPTPAESVIFGIYENETIVGFLHLEQIINLNCFYIDKKHRQKNIFARIINSVRALMPKGSSVFVLTDKSLDTLLSRLQGRKLPKHETWRFDF